MYAGIILLLLLLFGELEILNIQFEIANRRKENGKEIDSKCKDILRKTEWFHNNNNNNNDWDGRILHPWKLMMIMMINDTYVNGK